MPCAGDPIAGTGGGELFNVTRASLNNNGEMVFQALYSTGAGNNSGIFSGPIGAAPVAIALEGEASAGGPFGAFSDLALNELGDIGFQSKLGGTNLAHFVDLGGAPVLSATKNGSMVSVPGVVVEAIFKPALASNGDLLTRANLVDGIAGVDNSSDTVIGGSFGAVVAREGTPSSIPATNYGGLHNRIVTSENNRRYAFSAFLEGAGTNSTNNTGVFAGQIGGGLPALVPAKEVQPQDLAVGSSAALSENPSTALVKVSSVVQPAAPASPRLTTKLSGRPPESSTGRRPRGRDRPLSPTRNSRLGCLRRFETIYIGDDGSVCFFAYLKNATAVPAVNSTSDGIIWRWTNGQLHLIAREGDLANNTAGAGIGRIDEFACSGAGGIVYRVTYTKNQGDYTSATSHGVYVDRGGPDPVAELVLRKGDTFELDGDEFTVQLIKTTTEVNVGGGTGGYGRTINDLGQVLMNLTLSGGSQGLFLIGDEGG